MTGTTPADESRCSTVSLRTREVSSVLQADPTDWSRKHKPPGRRLRPGLWRVGVVGRPEHLSMAGPLARGSVVVTDHLVADDHGLRNRGRAADQRLVARLLISRVSLPSARGVPAPVGVKKAPMPAPAARIRSAKLPCGTSSNSIPRPGRAGRKPRSRIAAGMSTPFSGRGPILRDRRHSVSVHMHVGVARRCRPAHRRSARRGLRIILGVDGRHVVSRSAADLFVLNAADVHVVGG